MTQATLTKLPKSKSPWCLRCGQRVETLTVRPERRRGGRSVIVEYQCHGEAVTQEMPASELSGGQGLATYTAFNAYTSGLMLGEQAHQEGPAGGEEKREEVTTGTGQKEEGYVAADDAAQRLHARLTAERAAAAQQADRYAEQGLALFQIREMARAGFLLLPGGTDEDFARLWRTAFQVTEEEEKGGKK